MRQVLRLAIRDTTETRAFPEKKAALLYLYKYFSEMFVQMYIDKHADCTQHSSCADPLRTGVHLIEYFQKGVHDALLFLDSFYFAVRPMGSERHVRMHRHRAAPQPFLYR